MDEKQKAQSPAAGSFDTAAHLDEKGRPVDPVPTRVPWLEVALFTVIAMALAWAVCLPLWLSGRGLSDLLMVQLCGQAMMLTPLTAAIIVYLVQRRRARRSGTLLAGFARYLGIWPILPAVRVLGYTFGAILGVYVFVLAGYFLAASLGWMRLDLVGFSGLHRQIEALPGLDEMPFGLAVVLFFVAIVVNSCVDTIFTFGEEAGWRGWLLTSLRPLGTWRALLLVGIIWGLWHSPLILLGYNFARPNLGGVGLMVLGCISLTLLFGWLRLRSGSLWPAVFAHASLNASTGPLLALVIDAGSPTPDMALIAALGVCGWIVSAVVTGALVLSGQFRRRPTLAPPSHGTSPAGAVAPTPDVD